MSRTSISAYFQTLSDWKNLPAYRMETRVDSIVGFALPQILDQVRQWDVATVVPELPLRIGSVHPEYERRDFANRSYKVDFFVTTRCGKNLLVEFKTDSASRRPKQDRYLEAARSSGLRNVVSGILRLYAATTYKKKYRYLLDRLGDAGLVERNGDSYEISVSHDDLGVLYLQPHHRRQLQRPLPPHDLQQLPVPRRIGGDPARAVPAGPLAGSIARSEDCSEVQHLATTPVSSPRRTSLAITRSRCSDPPRPTAPG